MRTPEENLKQLGANVKIFMPQKQWGETSANDIERMVFPPVAWVIPGIVTEGLTIFAGKPKTGKSYLMLALAASVAYGGTAFGSIDVKSGDVLYLALEDNQRRLQKRMREQQPDSNMPTRLFFETEADRVNESLVDNLETWLDNHPKARLIIIDTLQRVRSQSDGRGSGYKEDYEAVQPLQDLAGRRNLSIIIVHHQRKMDAEDVFDTISGTNGLTGSCDNMMVLVKQNELTKLCGRGRDLPDFEKAVSFDPVSHTWKIIGDANEIASSSERQAVLDAILEAGEPIGPKDIAAVSGHKYDCVRQLLPKLVKEGKIEKAKRGYYQPVKWLETTDHNAHNSQKARIDKGLTL